MMHGSLANKFIVVGKIWDCTS